MARELTLRPEIRALQDRLTAEHPDMRCYDGLCLHNEATPPLPAGVSAVVVRDWRSTTAARGLVVLIRFTRREWGGWHVVRADNGRGLGWAVREEFGEYAGQWLAYVGSDAFRGTGPDDLGHVLDAVPSHLHRSPDGSSVTSGVVDYADTRFWAAFALVSELVREQAPAVGFGPHGAVRPYGR
ncbi:hypothetical protein I0C86_41240 [Plantactinospora sp. S1510]|uniref:Uncharacterized protein n=1 Tax=Plantactinospora alkalitolerans TaxID=2789879 RepID=A0ABS0HAQ9_9ACTN|nr:hypothetical protein [Plantactinospora alkalitolerans]MBF9135278.1 hypothetical protein [Plantactinospora alkalitolerans]